MGRAGQPPLSAAQRVLVAGCGYLGTAAARALATAGHTVFGARRDPRCLPHPIVPVPLDLLRGALAALPEGIDAVVVAVAPATCNPSDYRAAYGELPRRLLAFLARRGDLIRRAVLIGSTGVWEHDDGRWVDEAAPPHAISATARELVAGERAFHAGPFPATVLRLGGLYGPERTWLLDRVRHGLARPPRTPRYTNRIQRDDGGAAVAHVLGLAEAADTYVVVDDHPADEREVLAFLAARLGVPLPPPSDGDRAPGARGSKRCRNARLRATGFAFRYPSYQEGYAALLGQGAATP